MRRNITIAALMHWDDGWEMTPAEAEEGRKALTAEAELVAASRRWFVAAQAAVAAHHVVPVPPEEVTFGRAYYVQNYGQHPSASADAFLDGVATLQRIDASPQTGEKHYQVKDWIRVNPGIQYEGCWWLAVGKTHVYEVPEFLTAGGRSRKLRCKSLSRARKSRLRTRKSQSRARKSRSRSYKSRKSQPRVRRLHSNRRKGL